MFYSILAYKSVVFNHIHSILYIAHRLFYLENVCGSYLYGTTCVKSAVGFYCCCPPGFSNPPCNQIVKCTNQTCLNGGSCIIDSVVGNLKCFCLPG